MIKLSCPKCTTDLEIDDGFAGGICRCFECGTLMTVPAKAEGQAEILTQVRPDRPDRPESPSDPKPAEPSAAEPPEADAAAPRPTSPDAPSQPEDEPKTLVTASGRKVSVSDEQLKRVAVAQRQRVGIRIGALLLIFVVVGGLAVAAVMLGLNLLRSMEREQPTEQTQPDPTPSTDPIDVAEAFTYDPYANPYRVEQPNLFGLPMKAAQAQPTALIVDTSFYMDELMVHVRGMLPVNIPTLGEGMPLRIWLAREGSIQPYPDQRKPAASWDIPALSERLAAVEPSGNQALASAAERAVEAGARRLVLICGFKPAGERLETIATLVREHDAALDVIQLGRSSSTFRGFVEELGGRYAAIPGRRLADWRREHEAADADGTGAGAADGGA